MASHSLALRPIHRPSFRPFPRLIPHDRPPFPSAIKSLIGREQDRLVRDKLEKKDQVHERKTARWEQVKRNTARLAAFAATATYLGHQQGYRGAVKLAGIPLELMVTAAGYAGALLLPEQAGPVAIGASLGMAEGALGAFLNQLGRGHGREKRVRKGLVPQVGGSLGAMPLVDEQGGSALPDP